MGRRLLLASAGAGKSERLVKQALERAANGGKVLLLTYTINNQNELLRHICRLNKFQPRNVAVKGWFSFLLEDMVRPYQRCVVPERVSGIVFSSGNPHLGRNGSKQFVLPGRGEIIGGQCNPQHYVTKQDGRAHTHYLAKLAATINDKTNGKPAGRLAEIYDAVYIDEVQDLVGWDFSVLCAMVKTRIRDFECVGDFRQSVYQTSETSKKPQTSTERLASFRNMGFEIDNLAISWRCIQSICDLADKLHASDGHYVPTKSQITAVPAAYLDHQGVFAVSASHMEAYLDAFNPVILRWDRQTERQLCEGRVAYNFGESKGSTFERVLIIPPSRHAKFLGGDTTAFSDASTDDSRNKLYVAITRARYSVAFRHKTKDIVSGIKVWSP